MLEFRFSAHYFVASFIIMVQVPTLSISRIIPVALVSVFEEQSFISEGGTITD